MSRNNRIALALAICMSVCSPVLADGDMPMREAAPSASPAVGTEAEPTGAPTDAPSAEPTEAPTVAPSDEPTAAPTADPSAAPTAMPTSDPTALPSATAGPVPTAEPSLIEIKLENAVLDEETQIWQVTYQSAEDNIKLSWLPAEAATGYVLTLTDPQGNLLFTLSSEAVSAEIPVSLLGKDTYNLSIVAYSGETPLMQGNVLLAVMQGQLFPGGDMSEGGFPSGGLPSGGLPSGGMSGMPEGMADGGMPEDSSFHVTPGEALTDSHSSGSKNMRAFGTLELSVSDEAMSKLTIGGSELEVCMDGGQPFYAAVEGDVLILTPQSDGAEWSVNAFVLKVLRRSGIANVRLMLGGNAIDLSTEFELKGAIYAKLSAQGYVSKDYALNVNADGISVSVDGSTYGINNNELIGG